MNFASFQFWQILAGCFLLSRLVLFFTWKARPAAEGAVARTCLLLTGLTLLASESWLTLGAFAWVVLLGWICLLVQAASWPATLRTATWIVLLIAQLLPLLYFKYWHFLFNEILGLDVRVPSVLIPMGLSFYTFQTIGFWVDNLRQPQPRPRFLDYLNFASFFPQIVAGPIEKREVLLPQIEHHRFRLDLPALDAALRWIILGLAYKLLVADNLGAVSNKFSIDAANAWQVWIECLVFGLRIYFDFAGYSFVAIGLGLLFGVRLSINFLAPYWSADLRQFWRQWHITLGTWLRDYIYIPLGGRKVRFWALNTLIVFLVSGIWHGAGWGFLIWGLLHGIGVVACSRSGRLLPRWLAGLVTFAYVTFAWLFFLERDPAALRDKITALLRPLAYAPEKIRQLPEILGGPLDLLVLGLGLALAFGALALEGISLLRHRDPYQLTRSTPVALALIILIVLLAPMEESSFIYFNF